MKKYEAQIGNQFSQHSQREDFDPVAANEAPEGEKGLGATVFGGAGVRIAYSSKNVTELTAVSSIVGRICWTSRREEIGSWNLGSG